MNKIRKVFGECRKKFSGIRFSGLHQKIVNLVLTFILTIIALFSGVSYYQAIKLNKVVNEATEKQQSSIEMVSGDTMNRLIEGSLSKNNALKADLVDDQFYEIKNNIELLQEISEKIFQQKDSLPPAPLSLPDPDSDGKLSAQVLFEEGVDYTKSEYLPIAAHLNDTMKAVLNSCDAAERCFIGLADGTHIAVDTVASNKFDENGNLIPFPVRDRPWYVGAAESGDIYFTGIETDAFSGKGVLTCSAPVIVEGKTVAVVGVDFHLDNINEYVSISPGKSAFVFIVNSEGKVIFAPEDNDIFVVEISNKAENLRKSDNEQLSELIKDSFNAETDMRTVTIDDKEYYMTGAPIESVGWSVISVVDKAVTQQPAKLMIEKYDSINSEAKEKFRVRSKRSKQVTIIFTFLVIILGSFGALVVTGKIVRPIKKITDRMAEISGTDNIFEMDDEYRTGDEIEFLAQGLADLSTETRQYIKDITKITKDRERIVTELELARKIQADMLPSDFPPFPDHKEFDIYASMTPAKEVGGDFYDFFLIDDNHLGMVMADVSGKGIPAALFMMMSKMLVNNFALQGFSPSEVLQKTNEVICKTNNERMFVTVWFGILEISTGKITAANAGHEYPVIRKSDGEYILFKEKHGFVIGGMEGMKYREYEIQLERGGGIFLYTDGVPEATNSNDELFGTERMISAMNNVKDKNPKILLESLKKSVDEFVGDAEQFDDLTMLGLLFK